MTNAVPVLTAPAVARARRTNVESDLSRASSTVTQTVHGGPVRRFVVDRPVTTYLAIVLPVAWANMLIPLAAGWGIGSLTLVAALLGGLVGGAVIVSGVSGGRPEVRRLLAGVAQWRIGVPRLALVVYGLPVLTVLVAAITGPSATGTRVGWPSG